MDPQRKKELAQKVSNNPNAYTLDPAELPYWKNSFPSEERQQLDIAKRTFFKWFWTYGTGFNLPQKSALAAAPPSFRDAPNRTFQSLPEVWLYEKSGKGYYVGIKTVTIDAQQ
mmetsp:Transcript_1374/g.1814  ORF Transcript_1374/g.1814 Transcript_1374/m.1814 type:complete len:113 (+) Transcript_1374:53-391(+)